MQETEVKILEVDKDKCVKILIEQGAKKIFDGTIKTIAFDNGKDNLTSDKKFVRLRNENGKSVLGYKEKISKKEAKVMEEIEVETSDFETTKIILEKIGFSIWAENHKTRLSYKLDDARFDFDNYKGEFSYIPEFLEIEAKDMKTIKKYAKILGFEEDDLKPWGFGKLKKNYKKN